MNMKMDNKNIANNKINAPYEYYKNVFSQKDPLSMSNSSNVEFSEGRFCFRMLSKEIFLLWPDMNAVYADGNDAGKSKAILLARLVMQGRITSFSGRFLAYRQMPWGSVYERQFDGRCVKRLAYTYGRNLELFKKACSAIGGTACGKADASFDIEFLNGLFLRFLLWEADEEFPPSAQILFSDNFENAFNAEDMAILVEIVINDMKNIVNNL